jgi:CheY-like chemotaxis protein
LHTADAAQTFVDVTMPRMDGFQFLAARESHPELRDVPVIMFSARDSQGEPVMSNALAVAYGSGFSARYVLECAEALMNVLAPGEKVTRVID